MNTFPQPRSSFAATQHQGKIYVLGGHVGQYHDYAKEHFSDAFHVYDEANDTWETLANYEFPVQGLRMIPSGDQIYAFGGFRYEPAFDYGLNQIMFNWFARSSDAVYCYKISEKRWERIGDMPRRRSSYVAEEIDGKAYLIGGWDGTPRKKNDLIGRFHSMVDIFDVASAQFIPSSIALPNPTRRAFTSTVLDKRVVTACGLLPSGFHDYDQPVSSSNTSRIDALDPISGFLKPGDIFEPFPLELFSPGMCNMSGTLVVAGGMVGRAELSSVIYFLPQGEKKWRKNAVKVSTPVMFPELFPIDGTHVRILGGHGLTDPLGLNEIVKIG